MQRRDLLRTGALAGNDRGFSDACPRAAPRAVTGRHPKTLNDSRPFGPRPGTGRLIQSGHRWQPNDRPLDFSQFRADRAAVGDR